MLYTVIGRRGFFAVPAAPQCAAPSALSGSFLPTPGGRNDLGCERANYATQPEELTLYRRRSAGRD